MARTGKTRAGQAGSRKARAAKASGIIAGVIPVTALALQAPAPPAGAAAAAPGPAAQSTTNKHKLTWRDRANNRYLTVKDGSKATGARVTTSPTDHAKQQHWLADLKSIQQGSDYYDMKNVNSGKCLSVGKENPHKVQFAIVQKPCAHADTWEEYPMYNANKKFLGWALLNSGTSFAVCADNFDLTRSKSVYGYLNAESLMSFNHTNHIVQGCVWR
jgi:ricin-type beta-trefoil lectin protein